MCDPPPSHHRTLLVCSPEGSSRGGSEEQQHEPGPGHECPAGEEDGAGQAGDGDIRPRLQQRAHQQAHELPSASASFQRPLSRPPLALHG